MKLSLNKIICIYKIISPNGKIYVGQTRDYNRRLKTYKNLKCKNQPRVYNSLVKYGFENHKFEIIEECILLELNIRERYWQDFYDVIGKNGLNCYLTETDELPKVVSEETRKKMGDWQRGELNNMWGKSGELNPYFGKKHSEEVREKISDNHARLKGKNSPTAKLVLNLETGIYYDYCGEACKVHNINYNTFASMLNPNTKDKNKTNFIYC